MERCLHRKITANRRLKTYIQNKFRRGVKAMIHEIGVIFVLALALGLATKWFKQPLIPLYVFAGIIVGPLFLNLINRTAAIVDLSEMAAAIMLAVIGIEMDRERIKKLGLVAILGGIIQVAITFALGFGVAKLFGLANITSCYLGAALSFSSTMLVVKILGDNHDLNTLYGRITVGILIVQDLIAIFALAVLAAGTFNLGGMLTTITTTAGLILVVVYILGDKIFPKLFDYIAGNEELLFLATVAIPFAIAFYAINQNLTMGVGMFLAGLALASLSYRYEMAGNLKALKSFFSILFFASLGLQMVPASMAMGSGKDFTTLIIFLFSIKKHIPMIIAFVFLAVVVKPLITMAIVAMFGYEKETSFETGLSLGQFSEFGLVLMVQGIASDKLSPDFLPAAIIATVCSMTVSAYCLNFNHSIYRFTSKRFGWLDKIAFIKQKQFDFSQDDPGNNFQVILFGRDKLGRLIEEALRHSGKRYVVVDSDPAVITCLRKEGIHCIFGDAESHEVLERINFEKIEVVFSSLPDRRVNAALIERIGKINPKANFVGIVDSREKAQELYNLGAHYVLVTYMLAGIHLLTNKSLQALLGDHEDVVALGIENRSKLFESLEKYCDCWHEEK
jgi:Kef-type K+ transport system membrane component KefB